MAGSDPLLNELFSIREAAGRLPDTGSKTASLSEASSRKKAALSGADMYRLGAAALTGSPAPALEDDGLRTKSTSELLLDPSRDGIRDVQGRAAGTDSFIADSRTERDDFQIAGDAINSIGMGAANSVLGIGALAAGAVNTKAGVWSADALKNISEAAQSYQSDALNRHRRANAAVTANYTDKNKADYQNGEIGSLRRMARDAIDSVRTAASDPTVLSDGIATGVGSLMVAGPLSKAFGFAGKAAMPLSIGSMEAGGTYQQTVTEAMESMRDRTDLTQEQKESLANKAGLEAAAIQFPAAAAAGTLVSKFEKAPLRVGSIRSALGNLGRETIEEGIQSGSSQVAENIGIRQFVDRTRDLGEGVGEQVGTGALYGLGTAGVVQTPGVSFRVGQGTAKQVVRGAKAGYDATIGALIRRGDNAIAEGEKASPVAPEKLDADRAEVVANAPAVQAEAVNAVESIPDATPEEKAQSFDYLDRLFNSIGFDDAEADNQVPVIGDAIRGSTDRFDALRRVAEVAANTENAAPDRLTAGLYLATNMQQYQSLLESVPDTITRIPDEHPALPQLRGFESVLMNINEDPRIVDAVRAAIKLAEQMKVEDVSDEAIATPAGEQAVGNAVKLASVAPERANADVNDRILLHAEQGKVQLTNQDKQALKLSSALVRTNQDYQQANVDLKLKKNGQIVSKEIQTDEQGEGTYRKSAAAHMADVVAAMRAGNTDIATDRLQRFINFAQHMQNKIEAYNRNLQMGNGSSDRATSFRAYNPEENKFFKTTMPVWLNGLNTNSIRSAQLAYTDAKAVGTLANNLAITFPELGIKPINLVDLDPMMNQPAPSAAKAYRESIRGPKRTAVQDVPEAPKVDAATTDLKEAQEFERQSNAERVTQRSAQPNPQSEDRAVETKLVPAQKTQDPQNQDPQNSPVEQETVQEIDDNSDVSPEATEVVLQTEQTGIDAAYPSLIGSDGNLFKRAFTLPKEAISRVTGSDTPLKDVRKALSSIENFRAFAGDVAGTQTLIPAIAKAYQNYIAEGAGILSAMNERLANDKKIGPAYKKGSDSYRWRNGKVFNIVEDIDGKLQYNPSLQQAAVLAGLQWLVTADERTRPLDHEDVAKILKVDVTEVMDTDVDVFNDGFSTEDAITNMAAAITRYWGVLPNKNAPIGWTQGITQSVAAEILESMVGADLIEIVPFDINGKTYNRIRPTERFIEKYLAKDENGNRIPGINSMPSAIELAVATDPEEIRYIGSPPKTVATNQMRNRFVQNTKQQRDAITHEQNTPHYVNVPMVDFYTALGREGVVRLMGEGEAATQQLNKNHRKTIEGKNRGVLAGYDSLMATITDVERQTAQDKSVDETPIYYAYNMSRVSRMQMLGKHNPQANKLVREAILPTRSNIDLTDPADYEKFMLAIAQALGVKVHKQPRAASVKEVSEKLTGTHKKSANKSLAIIKDWLANGDSALDASIVKTMRDEFGGPVPAVAIHALMEYARMEDGADKKNFRTSLYVEADGVTDGPINALVHYATGAFNGRWLNLVAKGGLYFGMGAMTVNQYIQSDPKNGTDKDLYQTATDALRDRIADMRAVFARDPALRDQANAMFRVMDTLVGDLQFDGENITFDRGIAKNPLTVTIYGAGPQGIASKITKAMTSELYALLSARNEDPSINEKLKVLVKDLNKLTDNRVRKVKGDFFVEENAGPKNTSTGDNYTMTKEEINNLRDNIMAMFVGPLQSAINEITGDITPAMKAVQQATQIQSIYLKYAFENEIQKALELKRQDKDWKEADFLSQAELDTIYDKLRHMSPYIETGTQSFLVAKTGKVDAASREIGASLDDTLRTSGSVYGPKEAGVAGQPFLVIGPGDGQMIQNIATMKDGVQGGLGVFDGYHMKLSTMDEDAVKINQAVHQGWMLNPLGDVQKSYADFIKSVDLGKMSLPQLHDLAAIFLPPYEVEGASKKDTINDILAVGVELERLNNQAIARHAVLAEVQVSIDHMASAERPFVSEGMVLPANSVQQIAELNKRYQEKLNGAAPKPTENIAPELDTIGYVDSTGVRVVETDQLRALLNKLNIPREQKSLLTDTLKTLVGTGYKIVYGNASQTASYAARESHTIPATEDMVMGYTDVANKVIVLNNPSSETLVHELIHAATINKLDAYYNNPTSVNPVEAGAIQRIEALMNEWQANDQYIDNLAPDIRQANDNARNAVESHILRGDMAAAVNEFMAWTLANQDLSRIASNTKVTNPLVRIAKDALKAIKAFLFGSKVDLPGTDMLSNLRFNTGILLARQPTVAQQMRSVALFQSGNFGNNDRLSALRESYLNKIGMYLKKQPNPAAKSIANSEADIAYTQAGNIVDSFIAHGFPMSQQERSTFLTMVQTFATLSDLDPNALARVQELYSHVNKTLKVEDFMKPGDPDRYYAQEKYDSVMGNYLTEIDKFGRSSLMPAFLALANVNDEFRAILSKMDLPKSEKVADGTLDGRLSDAATDLLDRMSTLFSGERINEVSVGSAIESLSARLSQIAQDDQDYIAQISSPIGGAIDAANKYIVDTMQTLADRAVDKIEDVKQGVDNRYARAALDYAQLLASVVSEDKAKMVAGGIMSQLNKSNVWRPVQELFNEMLGRTDENKSVYDMIKAVRSMVQANRQQFREHLPRLIEKQFSRPLTDIEKTAMFRGIGKADLASLTTRYSNTQVLEFLTDPSKVQNEVATIESRLSVDGTNGAKRIAKAKQLANFMRVGEAGPNLLRNAVAIANLFGEGVGKITEAPESLITDIDHLVSLYALEGQDTGTKEALASLAQDEKNGVDYVLSYLIGQRVDEQAKLVDERAKVNAYKGYIPSLSQEGVSLIVAQDVEYIDLLKRGYKRIADYNGSTQERGAAKRGYYFSPVSGRASYAQGIIQNVKTTAGGIDPVTGFTQEMTAGRITDPVAVARIAKMRPGTGNEHLMPVYDSKGKVVAFERSLDPNQLVRLNRNTDVAEMIGVWRGRQAEEALAERYNEALIDNLKKIWDNTEFTRKDEFIDLFDKNEQAKDPVLADAVSLIPRETRMYIQSVFGSDGFPVRRDMLNDTVGYRNASIGDAWTGNTRWGPEMQKNVQKIATSVFGLDAYKRMIQAETLYKNFVTDARVTIVVKSVVVPVTNLIANIYQLSARGVPIRDIITKVPKKTAEINTYVKGRVREIELEANLRAATGDLVATRKINTELQSIRDSRKRMSIWPLLEAGEFSSVSEVGVGKEEIDIAEGKLSAYIEKLTDRLPDAVKTAGKYAIVGRDTALFKGLQRTVEYGDFIAKATLYDDLTKRQGLSREIALGKITEEFVNYDRLPGRTRGALESFGLMWFWNFKIRSTKIALSMIRNNPLHAFLSMMAPAPPFIGAVGNPITDNILAVAADGRLDNSIGIGQGLRAHTLNPYTNLLM